MKCIICNAVLIGRQKKFCSRKCLAQDTNHRHQNYVAQQVRGHERKRKLVEMSGGKCTNCGYNKTSVALSFHHKQKKSFALDIRSCSNRSWESLLKEWKKCQLLCLNCHAEHHWA